MDKNFIQDFTQGSIPRRLLRFSLPFMLSNAMQVLYSLVDMLVVGRIVGSYGLSAITIGSSIFNFMAMVALGFCTGGQIYISQLLGAGQRERLNHTVGTLFSLMLLFGAAMMTVGLVFGRALLRLMQTPPESYAMAVAYVTVCAGGVIFTYGYNMVSAVLRGMGDSRHPFIFIMIASVLNVVLDILFVGPLRLGTAGAALATIMGQAVSFFYAIIFLFRRRERFGFDFRLRSFRMDSTAFSVLVRLGIPLMLHSAAINISMMFVNSMVNGLGVVASAAFGVGLKLDDIANRVTQGVSMGVSSVVGQNFAAGKFDRVKRAVYTGWTIGASVFFIYSVCFLLFPREMFGFFTSDEQVIALGPVFISALVWSFPANAIMKGTQGFIQGIGNAKMSLYLGIMDGFLFRIGLSWLFGNVLGFGVWGFFFGYGMATYGTALPSLVYFLFGKWRERRSLA